MVYLKGINIVIILENVSWDIKNNSDNIFKCIWYDINRKKGSFFFKLSSCWILESISENKCILCCLIKGYNRIVY